MSRPLRVEPRGPVYKDRRVYCGPGPAVIHDPDSGRLTVAFRRVASWLDEGLSGHWHPATESCLVHSDDGGATWSTPRVFMAGAQCPNLRRLRDGTLVHHTHRFELVSQAIHDRLRAAHPEAGGLFSEGHWPGVQRGTGVWRSGDGGLTWGEPAWLGGVPGVEPLHPSLAAPLAVRGNLLETADGRLLVSAYSLGKDNTSHLFTSDDGGLTWTWAGAIAADANETCLHETRIHGTEAGRLLAFWRRRSDAAVLQRSVSDDGGATWSAATAVCRGYPACTAPLPSGRILLVYGYRFAEGYGLRARVLDAAGDDAGLDEVVLFDDGAVADLGYPDATALPDGRVVVVSYRNRRADVAGAAGDPDAARRAPRFIDACVVAEA